MDAKQMIVEGQAIQLKDQAARNAIADEYDSTSTYSVGDYCIYGGVFYRCTTAVTTAESFDSTKWTTTQVGDELLDIEADIPKIWDKLGTATLDTDADNVSDAVNELNSSKVKKASFTATTTQYGYVQGSTSALFGVANAIVLSAYLKRDSYNARRSIDIEMYGDSGYAFICKNNGTAINAQSVTITVTYVVID